MAAKKKDNNNIKTVTIKEGFIEEERGIGTIENILTGNHNAKITLPQRTLKGGAQCNCCPYGYHIDLDFVTYCEELYNGTYHHNIKHLCKENHKHRKSPEISMGIRSHLVNRSRSKINDTSLIKVDNLSNNSEKWKTYQTHQSHESNKSPLTPLKIGISIDTTDALLSNIHLSPLSQNDGPSLTPPFTTSHSRSGSNTSLSSTSTEFNTHIHHSNNNSKCTCGSQQIADTMAALNSASVIQSGLPPGYVGINTNVLSTIRSQVATSLQRMKELEEQAKAVPVLQVKLSVLNEEKRLLLLQLKNKTENLEEKSVRIRENNEKVEGSDDRNLSYAATLPRVRKRTLSGTSLGKCGIPLYSSTGHLVYSLDEPLEKQNVIDLKDFHSHQRIYDSIEKFVNNNRDHQVKEIRNVGTSCTVLTRDIGVGHIAERQRSVGIGNEEISMNSNKICIKCGRTTVKGDIVLDSLSSSEFAGSESDGESTKSIQKRILSKKPIHKILKTEDKSVSTEPNVMFSKCFKLTCNKGEQISILPSSVHCLKCEERAAIKYKNVGTNPKLVNTCFKSLGTNTDCVVLKDINVSTDKIKLNSIGSITDKIISDDIGTSTELSSKDVEALLLLQLKRKQMKDKGTGVPRPLLANVRIQTIPNNKDSSTSTNIETQSTGIQVNMVSKNFEEIKRESSQTLPSRFQKNNFEERKIINKTIQTENIQNVDASCGSCSIHDTFCNRCELRQMETVGVGNNNIDDIICDRCQNIKFVDIGIGEEKYPVFHSIGINTIETSDGSIILNNSGINVCDKCNAKIKSVAKDLVDKNMDVLQSSFSHSYKEEKPKSKSLIKITTETVQKKVISNQKVEIKQNNDILREKSSIAQDESCEVDSSDSANSESPDEKSYNGILSRIISRHKNSHNTEQNETNPAIFESFETPRKKAELSREMKESCKLLNDSLVSPQKSIELTSNMEIIQREWFQISSAKDSDPHVVEDYLDAFEEISKHLLHRIVNLTDTNGNTAMHYAVSHGNFDVVSVLLDSKVCDANIQNKAGYTAVMLISLAEIKNEAHKHVVQRLFQINDINLKASQNGQTALMLAASQGRSEAVKLLLECGAEINMQDKDGSTALMCAAEHGHGDVVHLLLANPDCDPSLTDNDGSSALSIAMDAGHRDVALMIYANMNFSRGSSPYSSLRTRRSRTVSSSRSSLPAKGSPTTPPPSPRPRRNSSSSSTF